MAFWRNLLSFASGAGVRETGQQQSLPAYYSESSASPVTLDSALQLSAVWACIKLTAEAIGTMPLNCYKKNKDGSRTLYPQHPLAQLFSGKVNKWQTRQEYFETLAYQLASQGNDFSAIQRNKQGDIIALVPLMTQQMEVALDENDNVVYQYTKGSKVADYTDKTIWQNKLFGNGIIGLSPIGYARNSIGIGQAAEGSVTKVYKNGGKPSGTLTIEQVISPEQREQIKKNFAEIAAGNEQRLFVLEAGMKYQQISLSPQDIELLASRRFQIEDIARFFGVPSVLINDAASATVWGSGVQQIIAAWYKLGLRPYIERYEASINNRLLSPDDRGVYEFEFDYDGLLKMTKDERVKTGKEAIMSGQKTPNEVRQSEGDAPLPGGDNLFLQQQMTPINQLDKINRGGSNAQPTSEN